MAYFAELDKNNIVLRVIVGINEDIGDGESIYTSETGTVWKKTDNNTYGNIHLTDGIPFRKNYAKIGSIYDVTRDAFIPPKPFPSWVLDEDTCTWKAPIAQPESTDTVYYIWDESIVTWVERKTGN